MNEGNAYTLSQAHQVCTRDASVTKSGWTRPDPPNVRVGSLSPSSLYVAMWSPVVPQSGHPPWWPAKATPARESLPLSTPNPPFSGLGELWALLICCTAVSVPRGGLGRLNTSLSLSEPQKICALRKRSMPDKKCSFKTCTHSVQPKAVPIRASRMAPAEKEQRKRPQ